MKGNKNEPLLQDLYIEICPEYTLHIGTPNCMHVVDAVTQNITKFTRKEPVRIRARKEDTKLNAPSSKSQRPNSLKLEFMPVWTVGQGGRWGKIELIMVQIESKIEFDLTFMENVLCVFGTTYWVLGRHNKYQKWFYRKCYNVIWFFIGWSRAIKCNLPMVFNTSCSKTPNFSPYLW